MTNNTLEEALKLALLGVKCIFICGVADGAACTCGNPVCPHPGKHPYPGTRPFEEATTDPDQLRRLWAKRPGCNLALLCGPESDLTVLDIDCKANTDGITGWDSLARLQEETAAKVPQTWTTLTGGKGMHIICRHTPELRTTTGLMPGIDVRSDRSYIIAPPSNHWSGEPYSWLFEFSPDDVDRKPLPAEHLAYFAKLKRQPTERRPGNAAAIPEGTRNDTLFKLAASMSRAGIAGDTLTAALGGINSYLCDPPLGLGEVTLIATSAGNRAAPGLTTAPILSTEQLLAMPTAPVEPLPIFGQPGFAVAGCTHLLAGHPKSGKSTLSFELMCQWTEKKTLYVSADESKATLKQRIEQFGGGGFFEHVRWLALNCPDKDAVLAELATGKYQVVIIDTLRSVFGFEEENNNSAVTRELQPTVSACRELGVTALLLHHMRKAADSLTMRGVSGASNLTGLVDVVMLLGGDRLRLVSEGRGVERIEMKLKLTHGRMQEVGGASRVLAALQGEPKTIDQLRQAAEIGQNVLPEILEQLTTTGAAQCELWHNPTTGRHVRRYKLPGSRG